jgi:undecaprenyl-diphosphatase
MGGGSWDWRIMSAVAEHRTHLFNSLSYRVMELGTSQEVLLGGALLCALLVIWRRAYRPAVAATASLLLAAATVAVLKPIIDRSRPPADLALHHVGTPAFPSNHAAITSAIAVALLVAVRWGSPRRTIVAAVVLGGTVVFIGGCMVYLGAHWPTDIVAGWLLGSTIGGVVGLVARPRSRSGIDLRLPADPT